MTKIVRVPKDCPHNGHNGGYYVVDEEGRRRGHVRRDHYMGGWRGDTCNDSGFYVHTGKPDWTGINRLDVVASICDHLELEMPA